MSQNEITVAEIKEAIDDSGYVIEIWKDAGVLELTVGEKEHIDIEEIGIDMHDEYSDNFIAENQIKSVFYISIRQEFYVKAEALFKTMAAKLNGFVCGDTDDFSPIIK